MLSSRLGLRCGGINARSSATSSLASLGMLYPSPADDEKVPSTRSNVPEMSVSNLSASARGTGRGKYTEASGSREVLYERQIPVRISNMGHDDRRAMLSLKLFKVVPSATIKKQVQTKLYLQITDDGNLYFLYTLLLSESDFHTLKREQNILVDFSNFSSNLIHLWEQCWQHRDEQQPKFLADLSARGSSAVLRVVETNDFKQLVHIGLTLRAGSDEEVKKYLAECLQDYKDHSDQLSSELESAQQAILHLQRDKAVAHSELEELRVAQSTAARESKASHNQAIAELREQHIQQQNELQARWEDNMREIDANTKQRISQLESRVDALTKEKESLAEDKMRLQADLSKTSQLLESTRTELKAAEEQVSQRRADSRQQDSLRFEHEKTIHAQSVRLATAEQQVKDKDELIQSLRNALEQHKQEQISMSESLKLYKSSLEQAERKQRDINKEHQQANKVIQHLQSELRSVTAKLKAKNSAVAAQRKELQRKDELLAQAQHRMESIGRDVERMAQENESLNERLERHKEQLRESQKQLKSNVKVIEFLNKELNESKLGALRPSRLAAPPTSTVRSFRPSFASPDDAPSSSYPSFSLSTHMPFGSRTQKAPPVSSSSFLSAPSSSSEYADTSNNNHHSHSNSKGSAATANASDPLMGLKTSVLRSRYALASVQGRAAVDSVTTSGVAGGARLYDYDYAGGGLSVRSRNSEQKQPVVSSLGASDVPSAYFQTPTDAARSTAVH